MTDTTKSILARLADKPGAIATEIDASPVEMIRMEKAGYVTRVGKRRIPGKRGRPAVEWAVTGTTPPEPQEKDDNGLEPWGEFNVNAEQARMLSYIDTQIGLILSGTRHDEDGGDERVLRDRRKAILREVRRSA